MPTALDDYLFDLRGFLILRNCVGEPDLERLNAVVDQLPSVAPGSWIGNSQRRDYTDTTGLELHNCLELDPAFDVLIDHPGWIEHTRRYAGDHGTYVQGVFIDECILSTRTSGGHHPAHSGGFRAASRTQYRYEHGEFRCGQVNVIVALRDVGPDDGPTLVVPGSHKSNFVHPEVGNYPRGDRMDELPGIEPVLLRAGDAVVFVDSILHGGATRRATTGERRVVILRYGPTWGRTRFGYTYSAELLDRLGPAARSILEPVPPIHPGETHLPVEAPHVLHRRLTEAASEHQAT